MPQLSPPTTSNVKVIMCNAFIVFLFWVDKKIDRLYYTNFTQNPASLKVDNFFPRQARLAKMAISRGLAINRAAQTQAFNNGLGAEIKMFFDSS